MRSRGIWGSAGVLALMLVAAAPVGAAPTEPVTLGTGNQPLVAVDDAGTAHFVWNSYDGERYSVTYCRIPRATEACQAHQALAAELPSIFVFDLLLRPGESGGMDVIVLARGSGDTPAGTYSIVSSDGGSSWTLSHISQAIAHDGQLAADRNYVELLGTGWFAQAPIAGPATTAGFDPRIDSEFYGVQLGRLIRTGATIMTGISGRPGELSKQSRYGAVRFLTATQAGAGNDPSAWTAWRPRPANYLSWLATGPGGAYVLSERAGRSCSIRTLEIMRFDGVQLGAPSQLSHYRGICEASPAIRPYSLYSHATQDLAGRLQAVWVSFRDGCVRHPLRCLIYRRASRSGRPLGPPTAIHAEREFVYNPRVAGGRDAGDAWAVWASELSSDGPVMAQRAFVSFEATLGDGTVRLLGPPECQPDGKRFRVQVTLDGVRADWVAFRVSRPGGGRPDLRPRRSTDRSAPYRVRLRVPRTVGLRTDRVTARVDPRGRGEAVAVYQDVTFGCGGFH